MIRRAVAAWNYSKPARCWPMRERKPTLARKPATDFSNKNARRPPITVRKVAHSRGKQHAILAADFSNKNAIRTPIGVRKVRHSRGKQGCRFRIILVHSLRECWTGIQPVE